MYLSTIAAASNQARQQVTDSTALWLVMIKSLEAAGRLRHHSQTQTYCQRVLILQEELPQKSIQKSVTFLITWDHFKESMV